MPRFWGKTGRISSVINREHGYLELPDFLDRRRWECLRGSEGYIKQISLPIYVYILRFL